jgi:hypothetical protein
MTFSPRKSTISEVEELDEEDDESFDFGPKPTESQELTMQLQKSCVIDS